MNPHITGSKSMISATNAAYRTQVRNRRKSGFRPMSWWAIHTKAAQKK
jgi:hypothetical protein